MDPGGRRGHSPGPVKISHKKIAAKGGCIDFMFLTPPYPATGSVTDVVHEDMAMSHHPIVPIIFRNQWKCSPDVLGNNIGQHQFGHCETQGFYWQ